jgi:hypothetical protein
MITIVEATAAFSTCGWAGVMQGDEDCLDDAREAGGRAAEFAEEPAVLEGGYELVTRSC